MPSDKIIGRKTNMIDDLLHPVRVMDKHDPIYDSESENEDCFYAVVELPVNENRFYHQNSTYHPDVKAVPAPQTLESFAKKTDSILTECYSAGVSNEVVISLKELDCSQFYDYFVAKAVRSSLDKNEESRRKMSSLLSLLYDRKVLDASHISRGFEKLLLSAEDIVLDVPLAREQLSAFFVCAAEDGIVSKSFLSRLPEHFLHHIQKETLEEYNLSNQLVELREYKKNVRQFLETFWCDGTADDAARWLEKSGNCLFRHEFVRLLISQAMSMTDHHCEMVSVVFDKLYGGPLKADDMQLGFLRLLSCCEDLRLDNPNATEVLCKFLARSVVDEILPPSFLVNSYRLHIGCHLGMAILKKVQRWLAQGKGRAVVSRFQKIWTGTDPNTKESIDFKMEIKDAIIEYFDSLDEEEATRIVHQLEVSPDQAAEAVRKILVFGMEKAVNQGCLPHAIKLIEHLVKQDEFDSESVSAGFRQTYRLLPEIKLDVPDAAEQLNFCVEKAKDKGLLPANFSLEADDTEME